MTRFSRLLAAILIVVGVLAGAQPASASGPLIIQGRVFDVQTMQPLPDVCVTVGVPGAICWDRTDATGAYLIDLDAVSASHGGTWELYFIKTGYEIAYFGKFVLNGPYTVPNVNMVRSAAPPPPGTCGTARSGTPTQTLYLPNITRNLGGIAGWYTPFIVQNVGTAATDLEVSFYKFSDGSCVERLSVAGLQAGRSYSNDPRDNTKNPGLPDDAQFSVVVRSFGSNVVGVVNEHQGTIEAMSYVGFTAGATTVYLPNITRRFFGFVTPFIIQNLGTSTTTATATFRPFDGSSGPVTISRTIDPGRAKPIDPNSNDPALGAPGLVDGKQYGVTVTASQPLGVVVNTQNDAPGTSEPKALSSDGITAGAATVYGAWAAKNASGWRTPIIVQNLGTTAVTPTITFTPLAGTAGTANTYTFPSIAPSSSKAFDPRFSFDTQGTTNQTCSGHSATCLADGEYAFRVSATGGSLAVQVNPESVTGAMGYAGTPTPGARYFLPNVTKSLCFCPGPLPGTGWTTPIILQSVTATSATLSWYRFTDGALVTTQTVTLTPGSGVRIDPWQVAGLPADGQYAVVVNANTGGTLNAIVTEFAPGGDNAMIYEGFAIP